MRNPQNVDNNLKIPDGRKLSPELMEELKNHAWERNFYPDIDPALKDSAYLEST